MATANTKTASAPATDAPNANPALDALKAISAATKPESKSAARREEVAARKAEKLTAKLEMLADGKRTTPKGKTVVLNVRATLVELVKTARLGATTEQLAATGVSDRFAWAPIQEHVTTFVTLSGGDDLAPVVIGALFPAPPEPVKPTRNARKDKKEDASE